MTSLKRIDNLDILCKDVGAVVSFYHETLGLPFFLPYVEDEEWAAIDAGNLTISDALLTGGETVCDGPRDGSSSPTCRLRRVSGGSRTGSLRWRTPPFAGHWPGNESAPDRIRTCDLRFRRTSVRASKQAALQGSSASGRPPRWRM